MPDSNPFLFVHLPLDEIRNGQVLDVSANRRHGFPHHAKIVADETFGASLEFPPGSFVKLPPWKLNPAVFLPWAANNPPGGGPLKLTFTLWLSPSAPQGEGTLIDAGMRKDLQRFKVRFRRHDPKLLFTVQAPAELDKTRGFRWIGEPMAAHGPWAHFAVVWDPKGEGGNVGYGICRMFLNGAPLAIMARNGGEAPEPVSGAGVYETFLGGPAFSGKLAHFRIYTRELTQHEIAQEIDQDLARQRKAGLLECSLLDPIERPVLLFGSASAPVAEKMTVVVKPLRGGMKLAKLPAGPPAPDRCHFELLFRPGVLNLSRSVERVTTTDPPGTWDAKAYPQTGPLGHVSVCIRCNSEKHLAENVQLKMVLHSFVADERFGARRTRVDLRYRNLIDDRGNSRSGRIPQWLILGPRERDYPPVLTLVHGWTQDPGTGLRVSSENTFLQGRLVCADAQDMMKHNNWGPQWGRSSPNFPYLIVAYRPAGYAPWPRENLRYSGRARWLSGLSRAFPQPKMLWSSDLCVFSFDALGIDADLPLNVHYAVGRIEVILDGVSYASEKSLLGIG